MGSLVAGWHTHAAKYERNKSLTKEEIEAYWRSKKKAEEDAKKSFQRSSSLPLTSTGSEDTEETANLEKVARSNTWWSRSSSAFLNARPVIESDSSAHRSSPYSPRGGSGNNKY